jgi:hypothetical protein
MKRNEAKEKKRKEQDAQKHQVNPETMIQTIKQSLSHSIIHSIPVHHVSLSNSDKKCFTFNKLKNKFISEHQIPQETVTVGIFDHFPNSFLPLKQSI